MPEIVVKGMDSAEAMEQVTKLLGPDALILSTVKRGNMVEITATDEPVEQMPKPAASSALETPSGFAQVLAKTLKKSHAAALPDYDSEDNGRPPAHNVHKERYDWPLETTALVGPLGAGKSQLALQIATQWMQHGQQKPRIIYCGNGSVSDAAYLTVKARLLSIEIEFLSPSEVASAIDADVPAIIVVSSQTQSIDLGIEQTLVVPAGLREDRVNAYLTRWQAGSARIVLTTSADIDAAIEDQDIITRQGGLIIAQSNRQSLSDGLTTFVIENDALAHQPSAALEDTDAPIAPPSLFRKRWASSNSAGNLHSDTSEEEARAQPGLKLLSRKANMS